VSVLAHFDFANLTDQSEGFAKEQRVQRAVEGYDLEGAVFASELLFGLAGAGLFAEGFAVFQHIVQGVLWG
jgi:hypothetical protein